MINVNKFPIIIISSPRTGSTILSEYLSEKYKLKLFLEPDENKSIVDEFNSYVESKNTNFILKFHARNFSFFKNLEIFSDSYLISIERKNKIDQIASHYIARARNRFVYNNEDYLMNDNIDVNLLDIVINCESVYKSNKALSNLNLKFDSKLFYEDLNFKDLSYDSKFIKTPKPSNYDFLIEKISKYLKCEHVKSFTY